MKQIKRFLYLIAQSLNTWVNFRIQEYMILKETA